MHYTTTLGKRRCEEEERVTENALEGGGGCGEVVCVCVQPVLNPFGSILCLAFCLTALKSHSSQPAT